MKKEAGSFEPAFISGTSSQYVKIRSVVNNAPKNQRRAAYEGGEDIMRLDYAFWPDVEDYLKKDDRILIPTGSVEQHGPAVATGIDYIIAEGVAERAAERLGVYAAPPLCYGMSLHHAAFPGTASLKPSAYLLLLTDLFGFFVREGFKRVVAVNGHGGNVPTLKAAAAEVAYEHDGARILIQNWYDPPEVAKRIEEAFGSKEGSHVTPAEVSILMYLRPELVGDVTQVKRTEPGLIKWQAGRRDIRDYYPQGAVGSDPSLASAELGKELLELAVDGVAKAAANL
jgi:creatinine amidohydrolase